ASRVQRMNGTDAVSRGPAASIRASSGRGRMLRMITTRHLLMTAVAAVWMVTTTGYAQQSVAPKILVAGENPAITLREKEGGPPLTSVNFWRVHWSPVGSGAVCFVTVSGQGNSDLRIAVHDNPKVLDYVTKELMSSL